MPSSPAIRREFLNAANVLARVNQPNEQHIMDVLRTLSAVLTDLADEPVQVIIADNAPATSTAPSRELPVDLEQAARKRFVWNPNGPRSTPTASITLPELLDFVATTSAPAKGEARCTTCGGEGWVRDQHDMEQGLIRCPDCKGSCAAPKLAHGHRDDYHLLANARRLAEHPIAAVRKMENWVLAMTLFATGSTSARQLCVDAGVDPYDTQVRRAPAPVPPPAKTAPTASKPLTSCHAARDGDCTHAQCPQLRDNEPKKSGRPCPLAREDYDAD